MEYQNEPRPRRDLIVITKGELTRKSKEWGIRFDIVEKDYCIGWLLKGIAEEPNLAKHFLFKGGTALKKCYFGNYRFSEDLDFSGLDKIGEEDLKSLFEKICQRVTRESGCQFEFLKLDKIRGVLDEEAYEGKISFRGPTQPQNIKPVIKIDLSFYEKIILAPRKKGIIHPYSDHFQTEVSVYSLEELLAEKLRAILQQRNRVPRPRDFYDVWMLLKLDSNEIKWKKVSDVFLQKCEFKQVEFLSSKDFFDSALLSKNRIAWKTSIARQTNNLIEFDPMIEELQSNLQKIFE